jgi:RNA polymerase sigma-70 factor (ECF subfamily)
MRSWTGGAACRDFENLLGRSRAGDNDARGRVLQQFWQALLHDARRDLPPDLQPKGGASDLVQETMLDAHKDFDRFHGYTEGEFFAWLQCLLRHNFANFARAYRTHAKRQLKREEPLLAAAGHRLADESPSEGAIRRESSERFRRAIGQMPGDLRDLITLRFDEGLTYADIGRRLGLTAEAVRKLLIRTLRLLGDELED